MNPYCHPPRPATTEWFQNYSAYQEAEPEEWKLAQLFLLSSFDNDSPNEMIAALMKRLTSADPARLKRGRDIILENINENTFSNMAPADAARALLYVQQSVEQHRAILDLPLFVLLPPGATDSDIETQGKKVQQNIQSLRDYLAGLANGLLMDGHI